MEPSWKRRRGQSRDTWQTQKENEMRWGTPGEKTDFSLNKTTVQNHCRWPHIPGSKKAFMSKYFAWLLPVDHVIIMLSEELRNNMTS